MILSFQKQLWHSAGRRLKSRPGVRTMTEVELPKHSSAEVLHKWFPDLNKDWAKRPLVRGRSTYIHTKLSDDPFAGLVIDLNDVILWDPFPEAPPHLGYHSLIRTIQETAPKGYALLGLSFAEAVTGAFWLDDWDTQFVACMGTILTFSVHHKPMYPRLAKERRTRIARFKWQTADRFQRGACIPLHPMTD